MQWLEITIDAPHEGLDALSAKLEILGVSGIITEDETDIEDFLENNRKYWDYVDEDFLASVRGVSRVKFYLEDSPDGESELLRLKNALPQYELKTSRVKDEDWENNWKEYYKPIEVGKKLLIVPEWEETPETERAVLRLDPGLIFGTGAHPTTQLCLEALEKHVTETTEVLDLGCGSGILSIAALILGAPHAAGCDIDEKAPDVVMENAALNGIGEDRLSVFCGDVLRDSSLKRKLSGRKFDVILANIVADVIISITGGVSDLMSENGVFICSGIIEGLQDEVEKAIISAGLNIAERREKDGWYAFICTNGSDRLGQ